MGILPMRITKRGILPIELLSPHGLVSRATFPVTAAQFSCDRVKLSDGLRFAGESAVLLL
jgi:hypothetical protein